ncbi:MAG: aldehyde dehydrogenase family protein [Acidobacteria bacterium]|nr:aldehyde dehydrogenase family protein [Acidobacteriota bacterium]
MENLFIDGQSRPSVSGETFDVFNPATGELYARVAKAGAEDANAAVAAAKVGARRWQETPLAEREAFFWKAAKALQEKGEEFVDSLIQESGSTLTKARSEVKKSMDILRAAAGEVRRIEGATSPGQVGKWSFSIRQPVGVFVAITPWNVPLAISLKKVTLALAHGNAVVLKPASYTPVVGVMMGHLFHEAGLPAGALNVVTGPGKLLGDIFATHPDVKAISFTGETVTGKALAAVAASHLKKFSLELGGKNPAIVLADADLEYAVQAITFAAFHHQGQNCMSVDRVIIEEPVHDQVVNELVKRASALKVGDPRLPETHLGPMVHRTQLEAVHRLVQSSVAAGARVLCGGQPSPPYYPPTVVVDVQPGMPLFEEETFGPVAPVIKARDANHALELANNSRYGLAAAVFTRDLDRAFTFAGRLEVGMVHINDATIYTETNAPFGGVKESGFGREGLGGWSWEEMTEAKWITFQVGKKGFPF